MKHYIMANDAGKDTHKSIGIELVQGENDFSKAQRIHFKTRKYDLQKGYIDLQGNSHKVKWNDEEYIIGEQGTDSCHETSKTDLLHQLSTYVAITQLLEPDTIDNKIHMVLACPVTVLKSEEAKADYKKMIQGDDIIKITVNDKNYEFEIVDIMLKAEGSGILYAVPQYFKNSTVAVIDIGGLNMTFTLFTNGTCANPKEHRFAHEYGNKELVDEIAQQLIAYRKGNIVSSKTAYEAMERGYLLNYGQRDVNSESYIKQGKDNFFQSILDFVSEKRIRLVDVSKTIFVGGTSQNLLEQISTLPNGVTTEDPQWSTVEGLFKVAIKKYKDLLK